ncbi:MAG TPA: hypothetical protein EYF95_00155 [Flavobacteriales bacterium]|jgi:hypothetical protein|nr:hypothetical protein [Flavobacteriales bacterium]
MNTWVEYWPKPVTNSWHLKWKEPETVTTRYFPDKETAMEFCTVLHHEDKYYTRIKTDGYR